MDTRITVTTARLDDAAQMAAFLQPIPNGDALAALLADKRPVSSRAYQDEAMIARFVESDGTNVTCYTMADITIDQAELIAVECDRLRELNDAEFRKAVGRALHVADAVIVTQGPVR